MICPKCGNTTFSTYADIHADISLDKDLNLTSIDEVLNMICSEEFVYCKHCCEELENPLN